MGVMLNYQDISLPSGLSGNMITARWCALVFLTLALLAPGLASAAGPEATPVGRTVVNFTLRDYRGASQSLEELAYQQLVVVAFLGTECPLAKLYAPRLSKLHAEFSARGV